MTDFTPTPEQREALSAPTPLLILAGAGTGKTTVLTRRIARLIASGEASPHEILALTFADKAALEMAERLGAILEAEGRSEAGREVTCRTFHSFGADVVRAYAPLLGLDGDLRVLSTPESWQLMSRVMDGLDFRAIELSLGGIGRTLGGLLGFFSQAKDHLVGPEELSAFIAREERGLAALAPVAAEYRAKRLAALKDVAAAYSAYEEAKQKRGCVDYGDLLLLPVRLFRAHPDIREAYRARFRHIFVDEYQDTNHAQRTLLMDGLLPADARIVVIGDDDQSIYGWRGAVIRNILDFPVEPAIARVGASQRFLTVNRRSGQPILDVANAVISRLGVRYEKRLAPMPGTPDAIVGHYVAATDEREAAWIADRIAEMRGGPEAADPTGKKRGHGVFAVLCRKRSLFGPVARALDERGIPYELIGGSGFYGRWEIRDVLSYLRVLADPADNVALARVLQSPSWRISDRDLFHLSEWSQRQARMSRRGKTPSGGARGVPEDSEGGSVPGTASGRAADGADEAEGFPFRVIDAVANCHGVPGLSPDAPPRLARLHALLDGLARLAARAPLAALVERVIEEAGYRRELAARPGSDSDLALLNLGKLVELARQFEVGAESLDAFVEYVQYALESGGEEAEVLAVDEASDAVKVMTVHQSKGLEFPVVFIPGLVEKIFPDTRVDDPDRWDQLPIELKAQPSVGRGLVPRRTSRDLSAIADRKGLEAALKERKDYLRAEALDEERRLFYVAITRAQRALFLTRAHWYGANTRPKAPSPFWDEVVDTGLSRPLGEEDAPGANPRLEGGAATGRDTAPRGENLARLLLAPDRGASLVARVAAAHPDEWPLREAAVEAVISAARSPALPGSPSPCLAMSASCTGLVQYDRCPRLYRYRYVDRLPQRPAPWATVGIEVHRRIEGMARSLPRRGEEAEEEREPDPDEHEQAHHGGRAVDLEDLLEVYRRSPFGRRPATLVEEPFHLPIGGNAVSGRIDRLDRLPDGSWQLADFKASRYHGQLLRAQDLQMRLYALAACRLWGIDPARLTCHLLFLVDGHQERLSFSTADLIAAESWVADQLRFIQEGRFPPVREPASCAACEYAHLC